MPVEDTRPDEMGPDEPYEDWAGPNDIRPDQMGPDGEPDDDETGEEEPDEMRDDEDDPDDEPPTTKLPGEVSFDVHAPIRIRGLKLSGPRRDYIVDFTDDDAIRPLAVIAGEIATGKTTVLEFIDYCLGARLHPEHEEILASVRTAQLAIEVKELVATQSAPAERTEVSGPDDDEHDTETAADPELSDEEPRIVRYVIERPVGSATSTAMLFRGDHRHLEDTPPRRLTLDPADTDSLSQFLLRACGMAGLRTRVTPAQDESKTHILSFRDVMPLCYLTNKRMDNGDLVLESAPPRTLKLRQVVDYFFSVSDTESSDLSQQIDVLRTELRDSRNMLKALRVFLQDAGVPDEISIEDSVAVRRAERVALAIRLETVSARLLASTQFAEGARNDYHNAATDARNLAGEVRERETLLNRLAPLRSQYADDLHKLGLLEESQRLFDALSVRVCPACQTTLDSAADVVDGHCTLCHSPVEHLRHHLLPGGHTPSEDSTSTDPADTDHATGSDAPATVGQDTDLAAEKRSVSRRLNELKKFITDVTDEAAALNIRLTQAQGRVAAAQQRLDATTSAVIAPFMTERDQLAAQVAAANSALESLASSRALLAQIAERERDQGRISAALAQAKERLLDLERSRQSRDELIGRLSRKFTEVLSSFGYPKLTDAYFNRALIPYMRGQRYERIGSSGAMTLIALAWQLTIFEDAVERGQGHPGFLLIDSPQKNLRPGHAADVPSNPNTGADDDIAGHEASIVDRIYEHVTAWTSAHRHSAQIIMVDNEPPARGIDAIAVRYSGRADDPPYGLIEDATE